MGRRFQPPNSSLVGLSEIQLQRREFITLIGGAASASRSRRWRKGRQLV